MDIANKYIIFGLSVVAIFYIYCKIIDAVNMYRVKIGLSNKIEIVLSESETLILNKKGKIICHGEPNIILYRVKNYLNKVFLIGDSGDINILKKKVNSANLKERNFMTQYDEVIKDLPYFWLNYLTYFALKAKKIVGLSHFTIPTVTLKLDIESVEKRNKIIAELEKIKKSKKVKLFNLL